MRKVPRLVAAALVALIVVLAAACSGGERPTLSAEKEVRTPATAPGATAPTVPPLQSGYTYVAQAQVPMVRVYASPGGGATTHEFENPWFVNDDRRFPVNTVFLVDKEQGDWLKVLLPVRPNGSTGWVRRSDVTLVPNPYRIEVDLSEHKLQVFQADRLYLEDTVAVGADATPTPIGRFYIRVLLQPPDPNTVYGAFAYGLSSHSETLNEFNGGDAEVGIHGNNDTSALGKDVSNGCIRMDNAKITQLTKVLLLGTPVDVRS